MTAGIRFDSRNRLYYVLCIELDIQYRNHSVIVL
jgi:hypothetical protein